jgi:hypothetical protein
VQEIELALIVGSALALLVLIAVRYRSRLGQRPLLLGALLGILPGILGAIVVLVPRTDLVPDAAEPYLWLGLGLLATGIAIIALSLGLARH